MSEKFIIGNNTFYINKKLNIIIIDEHSNNSESSVYISIDDFEDFIKIYNRNKEVKERNMKEHITFNRLIYTKPKYDGYYIVMRSGFTYDMGNDKDMIPEVGYWNGGRGCFNEDYGNEKYLFWTEIPEFEGVDFVLY